eukprot:762517-Hanusia_phi.AAC.2
MAEEERQAMEGEALLQAIREVKEEHPDFGIKRVWSFLKETKNLEVSEKKVKKIMQENGLIMQDNASSESKPEEGNEEEGKDDKEGEEAKKKKNAKKKKQEKARDKAAFDEWCKKILTETAYLVDMVPADKRLEMPPIFRGYDFTGSLRPAYVTPQVKVPPHILQPDYAEKSIPLGEIEAKRSTLVDIKEGDSIEGMRLAGRLGREVLDIAARFLRAGVTGDEIDRIVHAACMERNCYPSPLNYHQFPKSVCVSPNEVICHGIPDCRPIQVEEEETGKRGGGGGER